MIAWIIVYVLCFACFLLCLGWGYAYKDASYWFDAYIETSRQLAKEEYKLQKPNKISDFQNNHLSTFLLWLKHIKRPYTDGYEGLIDVEFSEIEMDEYRNYHQIRFKPNRFCNNNKWFIDFVFEHDGQFRSIDVRNNNESTNI